jgi:hypothetical protein
MPPQGQLLSPAFTDCTLCLVRLVFIFPPAGGRMPSQGQRWERGQQQGALLLILIV